MRSGSVRSRSATRLASSSICESVLKATREATQAMADDLFGMVSSGKIKIRVDQRYALKDVAQAHRDLEARKTTGSTVLIP